MQTITEYQTFFMRISDAFDRAEEDASRRKFDHLINKYIRAGWQPLGAPFIILDPRWQQIGQTMVKYERSGIPSEAVFTKISTQKQKR